VPPLPALIIVLRVRYFHSQHLLVAVPSGATSYSPTKPIVLRSAYFSDCAVRVEHGTEPCCTTGRSSFCRTVPNQVNNISILSGHNSLPSPVDRAVRSCEGGVGPHSGLRHSSDRSRKMKG